jgi:hypothetical protein
MEGDSSKNLRSELSASTVTQIDKIPLKTIDVKFDTFDKNKAINFEQQK